MITQEQAGELSRLAIKAGNDQLRYGVNRRTLGKCALTDGQLRAMQGSQQDFQDYLNTLTEVRAMIDENDLTNDELVTLIRKVVDELGRVGPADAWGVVYSLRAYVLPGCHTGRASEMVNTDEGFRLQLEWYAGQLLAIVDGQKWFAMSTAISLWEKFTVRAP